MSESNNTYAIILAGGSGERFWPLSRNVLPKQLLQIFDDSTLLEKTLERLEGLIPTDHILILTNEDQEARVRELAPQLPFDNILAEPAKRDTAPAIALGIGWVAARDPEATMVALPADQLITDMEEFKTVLSGAINAARLSGALVTIGVNPTWACPSYGYVERGKRATIDGLHDDVAVFEVARFREKPNADLAETFLNAGHFAWNSGMFIWTIPTVMAELSRHAPELSDFVGEVRRCSDLKATLAHQFPLLTKISIDYALMEKASRVLNVEATFDWDDVGSWISVAKYLPADDSDNRHNAPMSSLDSNHNIVFSKHKDRHIALLGVQGLIVVETDDAILVTTREQADRIKYLVKELPPELK